MCEQGDSDENICCNIVIDHEKLETSENEGTKVTGWKKVFAKGILVAVLLSKVYKEHLKLNNKKENNLVEKWGKHLNRHITKEDTQLVRKPTKTCYALCVVRNVQIKGNS